MDVRNTPLLIILFIVALILVTYSGIYYSSWELGLWREGFKDSPFRGVATAVVFAVVPMLAIIDLSKRQLSGLYLGLVPILIIFGGFLRTTTDLLVQPISPYDLSFQVYARMATIGFVISLSLFIMRLGFSKAVAAYFSEPPA